jgi:predicted extracellular nuclease
MRSISAAWMSLSILLGPLQTVPLARALPATDPPILEIFDIQGNGLVSPYVWQAVSTEDNIVTAVGNDGFFIQTPDVDADSDAETSNGIWVETGSAPSVAVGDRVDVSGTVVEYYYRTQIEASSVTVDSSFNPLPAAVELDQYTPSPEHPQPDNEMERFEGMRVRFDQGVVSAPTDQYGDACVTAAAGRLFREPGITWPGLANLPVWD